jgi:hypothetical protein
VDEKRLAVVALSNTDVSGFTAFWSADYSYSAGETVYERNVLRAGDIGEYDRARVSSLMEWKAGRFARAGRGFAERVNLDALNEFRSQPFSEEGLNDYWNAYASRLTTSAGIIWPLFVCHLAHPEEVPIYDVNVWHAWLFAEGTLTPERLLQSPTTFDNYLEYRAFFCNLAAHPGVAPRDLDKALMAFGQFLSSSLGQRLAFADRQTS